LKGKTICPRCKNEFILELTLEKKIHDVVCPKCKNKFSIEAKCSSKELDWEEYGEPRKTVLSCIKPRSNKPMIAAAFLICVFLIGILTAAFFDIFVQTTVNNISFLEFFKDNTNFGYSIFIVIISIFALISLFACIKREYFILAITGSFIAIFSFGFFFIGSILSIIAFILVLISRDEFKDEKKGKIF
jgi:DNA-directed RNA polymerase subunit RPC12/RpoP